MFRDAIQETPLTSEAANSFFQNISKETFMNDSTFSSTLRALVAPRMGSDDSLRLAFTQSAYTESDIRTCTVKQVMNAMVGESLFSSYGCFVVHNFRNPAKENNEACMDYVDTRFTSEFSGYRKLESVTNFFRKSFPALCFINDELKSTILFVERLDLKKYHYLQTCILPALPWYFDHTKGLSDDELAIVKSLRESTPEAYLESITKVAGQYDFKKAHIRQLLDGFETRFEKQEIENISNAILNIEREIERFSQEISTRLQQRHTQQIRLLGFETKIAQDAGDSELMEYFLCSKSLHLMHVNGLEITFAVSDYLDYIDEDLAIRVIENKNSSLYGHCREAVVSVKNAERFLKAVFIDKILKIRTCAAYRFLFPAGVSGIEHYPFSSEFGTFYPNPHIDALRCLGNYRQAINDCLRQNDYIGALEQSVASCKSLNFSDSVVISRFSDSMFGTNTGRVNIQCVELPDGSIVKPKEAISWLDEHCKKET